jgi:hypothetical protein
VFHAAAIEHGIAAVRDESAIEIGAQKAKVWGHRGANLWFDRVTATRLQAVGTLRCGVLDRAARCPYLKAKMKSAYELAMERLEKKAPSVALTDEQKQQIAEIDSTFKARIAERELFLKGEIGKAHTAGNLEEADTLQKQLSIDIRRFQEDAEAKKEKLRASFAA